MRTLGMSLDSRKLAYTVRAFSMHGLRNPALKIIDVLV